MTTTTFTASVITDSYDPIFSFAASGDTLIVNEGVTLANQGDYAVYGRGANGLHDLTALIDGTLSAPGWAALDAYTSSIDVTVGSTGRLESEGAMAMEASGDSTLANHGILHAGRGFGVVLVEANEASVENWGTIFGEVGAVEFISFTSGASASLVNHGTLQAGGGANDQIYGAGSNQAVYSNLDTTTIVNDGAILAADRIGAAIAIDGETASIENSGSIESLLYWGIFAQGTTQLDVSNHGTIRGAKGSLSLANAADTVTNDGLLHGRAMLGGGNDVYHGEDGRVVGAIWGQSGDDLLVGGAFADILGGGSGSDTLAGGAGDDRLTGAAGADRLAGAAGDDVFRFAAAGDATGDRIVAGGGAAAFQGAGTSGGDRLDLSTIDAVAGLPGNQSFSFGTTRGLGDLWAVDVGGVTHIRGNTAGGTLPEFDLAIHDGAGVHASDYAAIDFIL